MWSAGCVLGECALLRPLAAGADTGDQVRGTVAVGQMFHANSFQLAEIVELLGTPDCAALDAMQPGDSILASVLGSLPGNS